MYRVSIRVGYNTKDLTFNDFIQVSNLLRYLVAGSNEAIEVIIAREEGPANE